MQENNFNTTVQSLFKGMDSFISTKTVVGEAVHIGDTIILPLIEVSFGVGAGAFCHDKKNNAAGGMGGKIAPSAVLVVQNGTTKLVNVKNQDWITKVLDMVPDLVNKFSSKNAGKGSKADQEAREAAAQELSEKLNVAPEE
ncbi:MAG: sporulation protein [Lachnospiraceae bacterium]|nr:sporulation protein [Lachnospiraceae bacterium]